MAAVAANRPKDINKGPGVVAFNFALGGVALIVVSFRIYTRVWIKNTAGWDDFLIVVATVCALAYSATQTVQVVVGHYGHHSIYVTLPELIVDKKSNPAASIFFSIAVLSSRASICILLLRILADIRKWKYAIYSALILNIAASTMSVVVYAIFCVPVEKGWDNSVKGFCVPRDIVDKLNQVVASVYIVVDFACAGIPFAAIRKVQMDRIVKLLIYPLLTCGLLTAACSIGRLASSDFRSPDPQYANVPYSYWTAAEMYGAIIFSSLPALRQLCTHVQTFRTLKPSSGSSGSGPSIGSTLKSRSRKRSVPNINLVMENESQRALREHENGVRRTTDVYVELEDMENGAAEQHAAKASGGCKE